MTTRKGRVTGVNGNMVKVEAESFIIQNEVAYIIHGDERLKAEVIRVRGAVAETQVYENTAGLSVGDTVEFSDELLSVELGPGLLGQIFDGLQNPLPLLAERSGFFLKRGLYLPPLQEKQEWEFTASVKPGDRVRAGDRLGSVPEKIFRHAIMVPFSFAGEYTVESVSPHGRYDLVHPIARLKDADGKVHDVTMRQVWPVKVAIKAYAEKVRPATPLVTKMRIIDSLFPLAVGGTSCTPGPFGAGKTVLQQLTSRHADVDVVVIAACGERAGEVVETLKTFPTLVDPRTGRSLIDRTVIICNTSSMPVAARESSVYTAVTIAEYYRQMGLNVLLLADSTSRWAQAMREMSGRLEEIPGDEAFPAYLESRIASFYERAGIVRLHDGTTGSVTIAGTVSPAGGNFEEPVTQATLKVVGAFHGLSRERSDARRYPAIDPLTSWSKYKSFIDEKVVTACHRTLHRSHDVAQMMKVIGEEGTSLADYIEYLKGEFLDSVYLQQNAFDAVDEATPKDRQVSILTFIVREILDATFELPDKAQALRFFQVLRQLCRDWNSAPWQSAAFEEAEAEIRKTLDARRAEKKEALHA